MELIVTRLAELFVELQKLNGSHTLRTKYGAVEKNGSRIDDIRKEQIYLIGLALADMNWRLKNKDHTVISAARKVFSNVRNSVAVDHNAERSLSEAHEAIYLCADSFYKSNFEMFQAAAQTALMYLQENLRRCIEFARDSARAPSAASIENVSGGLPAQS